MTSPLASLRTSIERLASAAGQLSERRFGRREDEREAHDHHDARHAILTPGRVTLLLLAGLGALAISMFWSNARQVTTTTASLGRAAEIVYATGIVEPVHWAKVTALQRRRIVEICRCEGKAVKAGEVLAKLDDAEERAHLTELEARLKRLNEDADRLTRLVERNIAARATRDEKLTQVREQEARVVAQRERMFDLSLRSPVDGTVLRRDGEVGEIAGTGPTDTLFWVGQERPLQIVAEVNEDDILKVAPEQKTLVRHEGHRGEPLTGTVSRITPKGDPSTKTFRVYIALPDDTPLRIGMSVEANIVAKEVALAVLLPPEAVGDGKVMRIVDGRAVASPVEIGIRGATLVEIERGLEAGSVVVSPFPKDVHDGDAVRPAGGATP
ncbi:MAG: efflux RND transporter periplasmic adaptor subunit [Hyphomicrobiaceae bacterium]